MHHDDSFILKLKLCFILGISQRSGTNYIYRLLGKHSDCMSPGPIWEDFLVNHSQILKNYIKAVYHSFHPEWEIEKTIASEALMQNLGSGLRQFLKLQIIHHIAQVPYSKKPKILLTKTPTVTGLINFFDMFPDDYLIIIIRDGRSIVESGVKSFGWSYENAMRSWATSAKTILDFKERYQNSDKKLLIVKYEDLFKNERNELLKIFAFLNLDPNLFDFDSVKNLEVTGSSELTRQATEMHWQPIVRTTEFSPLTRFSNWNRKKHGRFNWIAGLYMSEFGYELEPVKSNKHLYIIKNKLLDYFWSFKLFDYLSSLKTVIYSVKKLFFTKNLSFSQKIHFINLVLQRYKRK